jgi:hypothetical protein
LKPQITMSYEKYDIAAIKSGNHFLKVSLRKARNIALVLLMKFKGDIKPGANHKGNPDVFLQSGHWAAFDFNCSGLPRRVYSNDASYRLCSPQKIRAPMTES